MISDIVNFRATQVDLVRGDANNGSNTMSTTLGRVTTGIERCTIFIVWFPHLNIVAAIPNEAVECLVNIRCGGDLRPWDVAQKVTEIGKHILDK